jgi:transmembrane sensor
MASERVQREPRLTSEGGTTAPLGSVLRDEPGEARVQSMWQRIDHAPVRRPSVWLVVASAAAVAALLLLGVTRWLAPPASGPLVLASGHVPAVLAAEQRAEAPRFDDGSQIQLQKGARLEVLRNDARSFVTALRRGEASFDVTPGGKRHWVIEAGELTVEVVGTRFRVERQVDATRVSVDHGVVLVRGERVSGGVVRLTAGQSFELLPLARAEDPAPPSSSAPPVPSSTTPVVPSASRTSLPAVDPVARDLAEADGARQRGDVAAAARHFEAAWTSAAPGDARRGLAALSLARLLRGGNPAKVARILRSSLPDMPSALLEDAHARLVEAESLAGDHAGARRAAEEYRRRFPAGQRLDEVERWSAP